MMIRNVRDGRPGQRDKALTVHEEKVVAEGAVGNADLFSYRIIAVTRGSIAGLSEIDVALRSNRDNLSVSSATWSMGRHVVHVR